MPQRRLLLVRHAKAGDAPVDADRPLTERGQRQSAALGAWIQQAGPAPDRVLVSPARRALQTWEMTAIPAPSPIVDARIYDNTVEALLAAIRETPDDVATVAVVGHNPSIAELTAVLDDGEGNPAARRTVEAGFPTAAVAVFDLALPFDAIAPGTATLSDFTRPSG
ncbi:MAG: histidine phosphatase family protein [Blastococcus sp.]